MKPTLVIMAAGMGSRFGGLKQIEPVTDNGEVILDFSLFDAKEAGFEKVVFVIKKEIEDDFKKIIENGAGKYLNVEYAFQDVSYMPAPFVVPEGRTKPWGTAHAVLTAGPFIDGPFAVINADDYYGKKGFAYMYEFLSQTQKKHSCAEHRSQHHYESCMIGYELAKTLTENGTVSRGVCTVDENNYLDTIVENTKIKKIDETVESELETSTVVLDPKTTVSMNFWGFSAGFINEIDAIFPDFLDNAMVTNPIRAEFYIPHAVDTLIKKGITKVKVMQSDDEWHGVTYAQDKHEVSNAFKRMKSKGLYPSKLWR